MTFFQKTLQPCSRFINTGVIVQPKPFRTFFALAFGLVTVYNVRQYWLARRAAQGTSSDGSLRAFGCIIRGFKRR